MSATVLNVVTGMAVAGGIMMVGVAAGIWIRAAVLRRQRSAWDIQMPAMDNLEDLELAGNYLGVKNPDHTFMVAEMSGTVDVNQGEGGEGEKDQRVPLDLGPVTS